MARRPNRTRHALLGFLSWGPQSGYGLRKIIDASVSNFWTESFGRIYPMLAELVRDGLATAEESVTPGGRPSKVYALTQEGEDELRRWLEEDPHPKPRRNEFLLQLFFAARGKEAGALDKIRAFRQERIEELARYAETRRVLEGAEAAPPDRRYWLMTLRYGELEAEATLRWAEEAIAELEASESPR